MRHTLFISDLHLQENTPATVALFSQFIEEQTPNADALYILGDFFEAWIGDDDQTPFNRSIQQMLITLTKQGIPIFFMHGNRDFLIGNRFAQETGMTLLPDPSLINLYGKSVLLSHGDCLCTLDVKHQRYRRVVLQKWLQKLVLQLPLKTRQKIANYLRQNSQGNNATANSAIMDVTDKAVAALMQKYSASLLIHGHTHRPQIHTVDCVSPEARRIVLGAWHENRAQYLRFYENGEIELTEINGQQP